MNPTDRHELGSSFDLPDEWRGEPQTEVDRAGLQRVAEALGIVGSDVADLPEPFAAK